MIFLGTPQLRGGVNIFFFYKVSFEKHPNVHTPEPEETVVDTDNCQLERQRHSESMVLEIDNRGYYH